MQSMGKKYVRTEMFEFDGPVDLDPSEFYIPKGGDWEKAVFEITVENFKKDGKQFSAVIIKYPGGGGVHADYAALERHISPVKLVNKLPIAYKIKHLPEWMLVNN